ncbi:MAG: hypothetical protein IKE73_05065 [Bacilli bacterium]|nr:hypothetical protein [Bacilli bacterium]
MKNNEFEGNYLSLSSKLDELNSEKDKHIAKKADYVKEFEKSFEDYDAYKYSHLKNDKTNYRGTVELADSYIKTIDDEIFETKTNINKSLRTSSGFIRDKISLLKIKKMKIKLLIAAAAISGMALIAKPKLDELEYEHNRVKAASEFIDDHFNIEVLNRTAYLEQLPPVGSIENANDYFNAHFKVTEISERPAMGEIAKFYEPSDVEKIYSLAMDNGYSVEEITKALMKEHPFNADWTESLKDISLSLTKSKNNTK